MNTTSATVAAAVIAGASALALWRYKSASACCDCTEAAPATPAASSSDAASAPVAASGAGSLPKLYYFNLRGRGESVRLALHDLGVAYVEECPSFEAWGAKKADLYKSGSPFLEVRLRC